MVRKFKHESLRIHGCTKIRQGKSAGAVQMAKKLKRHKATSPIWLGVSGNVPVNALLRESGNGSRWCWVRWPDRWESLRASGGRIEDSRQRTERQHKRHSSSFKHFQSSVFIQPNVTGVFCRAHSIHMYHALQCETQLPCVFSETVWADLNCSLKETHSLIFSVSELPGGDVGYASHFILLTQRKETMMLFPLAFCIRHFSCRKFKMPYIKDQSIREKLHKKHTINEHSNTIAKLE